MAQMLLPAAFCAALINSQPMGFYAPAQLVREAQRQGVHVLPVCINRSDSEADLERHDDEIALRLGFNQISGLAAADSEALVAARRLGGAFDSVADCAKRAGLAPAHWNAWRAPMRLPVLIVAAPGFVGGARAGTGKPRGGAAFVCPSRA